jgi:hypothetical protein
MGAPNVVLKLNGSVLAAGVERMTIPSGGAHVRVADVLVPASFSSRPTVTGTVHARSGPGVVGTVFGIFNIKVERDDDQTRFVIQATNTQKGQAIEGDFDLDYVIVGNVD